MIIFLRNQSIIPTLIFQKVDEKILSPYRGFLEKNIEKDNVEFFERAAQKNWVMKLS